MIYLSQGSAFGGGIGGDLGEIMALGAEISS